MLYKEQKLLNYNCATTPINSNRRGKKATQQVDTKGLSHGVAISKWYTRTPVATTL